MLRMPVDVTWTSCFMFVGTKFVILAVVVLQSRPQLQYTVWESLADRNCICFNWKWTFSLTHWIFGQQNPNLIQHSIRYRTWLGSRTVKSYIRTVHIFCHRRWRFIQVTPTPSVPLHRQRYSSSSPADISGTLSAAVAVQRSGFLPPAPIRMSLNDLATRGDNKGRWKLSACEPIWTIWVSNITFVQRQIYYRPWATEYRPVSQAYLWFIIDIFLHTTYPQILRMSCGWLKRYANPKTVSGNKTILKSFRFV